MSSTSARRPGVIGVRVSGAAIILGLLLVLFTLTSPNFASAGNLANVLTQSSILLMLALPMTLIVMTEGLDLSIGAVLTLASLALAMASVATGSATLGLLAAVAVGLLFGLGNGLLVSMLRLPPFVATLGTLGVAQGLCLVVSGGQSVVGIPPTVGMAYSGQVFGIPVLILMAAVAYLVFHVLLYWTRFGVYVPALGGNREALHQAGVRHRLVLVWVYVLAGLMAGLAALPLTARMNAGHPTAAMGMEFDAIAAVAVGGTAFVRGDGSLSGTLLGVLSIGVLRNGLNLLALPSSVQVACVGVLVIAALFLDNRRRAA